jgi:predicted ATPase
LAIELAAADLDVLGLAGLDLALGDLLQLPRSARRTTQPQHQSLRAMLDWSYRLLTAPEQRVLRRISILSGDFSLDDALAVASDENDPELDVLNQVVSLVAKSLIRSHDDELGHRLCLWETTRAYAAEKLRESGELDVIERRHSTSIAHRRVTPSSIARGSETRGAWYVRLVDASGPSLRVYRDPVQQFVLRSRRRTFVK